MRDRAGLQDGQLADLLHLLHGGEHQQTEDSAGQSHDEGGGGCQTLMMEALLNTETEDDIRFVSIFYKNFFNTFIFKNIPAITTLFFLDPTLATRFKFMFLGVTLNLTLNLK